MIGRTVRVVCLAMAAWALLFAPGAAAADTTGAPGEPDASRSNRVAAAVLAPTFDSDSVARSVRACPRTVDDRSSATDIVVASPGPDGTVLTICSVSTVAPPGASRPTEGDPPRSVSLRAPPAS